MITQLCRLGWLGSLHVLLYIPCHVLLSQARQTAVMARAKQACEEMHIDWYQPQACHVGISHNRSCPKLVPNPMVYLGQCFAGCRDCSSQGSSILMTMSSCIHRNTGRSGSCWQIATGTMRVYRVCFMCFINSQDLLAAVPTAFLQVRIPGIHWYPMNLQSRNISKQAPFRWHLEVSECVRQKSHVRHTCQTWRRCINLPRWGQCCRNFLDSLLLYLHAIH